MLRNKHNLEFNERNCHAIGYIELAMHREACDFL